MMKARKLRWERHAAWSNTTENLYTAVNALIVGKISCRRPKIKWIDEITKMHTGNWKEPGQDRQKW